MDEGREDQGVERGGKRALDTRSEGRAHIKTLLVNTSMLHFVHMLKALLKHVLKLDIES